ncbi:predicted protein [Sparassis crispa]|uniref:Uncharacterized protein n=1 Tax=Sparassis crispa TaxID=139825 RepID=A0A401GYV2_9APHY|nr:predicted protein [Sparassis crispa]GBE87334.1 predicted protein [Sparassis crispa]
MLPYALKIAWFTLSLAGLLASLLSIPAVRKVVDCCWIPLTYTVMNIVLQGVFCLGLIWRMNPLLMPRAFCITQATLMTTAWFILTAMCACVTLATSIVIYRSYNATRIVTVAEIQGVIKWRPVFLSIMVGYPAVALLAYIVVALKLSAIQPKDDMHCDTTSPVWVRVLSYAGVPLLFAVPSFLFSCTSVFLLSWNRLEHHSQVTMPIPDNLTLLPTRRASVLKYRQSMQPTQSSLALQALPEAKQDLLPNEEATSPRTTPTLSTILYAIPSPPASQRASRANYLSGGRAPISPLLAEHAKRYHLPFSWRATSSSSSSPEGAGNPQGRPGKSPSPLTFAMPSAASSTSASPVAPPVLSVPAEEGKEALQQNVAHALTEYADMEEDADADDVVSGSIRWATDSASSSSWSKSEIEFAPMGESIADETQAPLSRCAVQRRVCDYALPDRSPAHLSPLVWRILAFQLLVSVTQILAVISSLVDVFAGHSPPAAFGTQHVALLLVAWMPSVVFGIASPRCVMDTVTQAWSSTIPRNR